MNKVGRLSLLMAGAAMIFAMLMFALPADSSVLACWPTETKKPTCTEEPTDEPTAKPTDEPTAKPTDEPTDEPTVEPTDEPTVEPTDEPTVEPTDEPTVEPTDEPTPEPTTPAPTEEPTQEPPPIDCPWCDPGAPIVYYVYDETVEIYTVQGQPLVIADQAFFNSLPTDVPSVNTELWRSDDDLIVLYRLNTGEYQFNYGPDETGYVSILIFDVFPTVWIYDYQYYYA